MQEFSDFGLAKLGFDIFDRLWYELHNCVYSTAFVWLFSYVKEVA
jgi:hypothetical protein